MNKLLVIFTFFACFLFVKNAFADTRFQSQYPCSDTGKVCVSKGMKTVDGFAVHRDCWKWQYTKQCNYPSKNDCYKHSHCYSLGQRGCLLRDSLGRCINMKKEFSCKRWTPTYVESETTRYGLEDKEGAEGLICTGSIPCIDGNCFDKSYNMDADMVQSVSQLGAMSSGKRDGDNVKIFEGVGRGCSKKFGSYTNCCAVKPKGWGRNLGAKCQKDEEILAELRQKNLCVSVGSTPIEGIGGIKIGKKHRFCCFGNILEKTIQVEGRKQLGLNFGSGGSPNCRGLNLQEISKIDFSKMNFSAIAADMHKKIAVPNAADVEGRIKGSFKGAKFDKAAPSHPKNKSAGVNKNIKAE